MAIGRQQFSNQDQIETTTMTNPRIPVTEDELHAYVDNELPAERRGDVEAWLSAHPDDAARVQAWRTMAEALHARYDSVLDEAVPKRLEIERLVRQPRQWIYGAAAAALIAFIAGGGVGAGARGGRRVLGRAWRASHAHRISASDLGGTGCAPAVRRRGPASCRSAGQRARPSSAMADAALRLDGACAGTGRNRLEAGRRAAIARSHRAGVVPDV